MNIQKINQKWNNYDEGKDETRWRGINDQVSKPDNGTEKPEVVEETNEENNTNEGV